MSKVHTGATMSLDGYIAGPDESGFDRLFQVVGNGDVECPPRNPEMTFRMTQASVDHLRALIARTGRAGRRAQAVRQHVSGWGGRHPLRTCRSSCSRTATARRTAGPPTRRSRS